MNYFFVLVISIVLSIILGFTIVPDFQEIEIFTTCLTVFSICLALFCFVIPKWEVWRDKLFEYDQFYKEKISDNIKIWNQLISDIEQLKEIDPIYVKHSIEDYNRNLEKEISKLNNHSDFHKMAEATVMGYKQIILLSITLLFIHFVINVLLIPSEVFVNLVKTNFSLINTDSLIWFVKRLSSSIKIVNIAVQFVFLYKISTDTIGIIISLKSKENIEKSNKKSEKSE